MDISDFNEAQARELVNLLLSNDIKVYRKLLPEIENLNSEDFENLFNGNYNYEFNVKNKKNFKNLCIKFDNFHQILEEWYEEQKYYKYLIKLWSKYPCIEDLKYKEEDELKKILLSYSINYDEWPSDIKTQFKILISSTDNTKAFELKKLIEDKFAQLNCVLDDLVLFQKQIKNQGKENNIYEKNSELLLVNIVSTLVVPLAMYFGNQNIQEKEIKAAKKYICNNLTDQRTIKKVTKNFITCLKNNYTGKLSFNDSNIINNKYRVLDLEYDDFFDDECFNINFENGNVKMLEGIKKVKAFFKSKMVYGLHAALSFLNLGWSVYNLTQTYKGYEQVKKYNIDLEEIVSQFNIHKNEIGILPNDLKEATERIKNVLGKIRNDQKNLRDLIEKIEKSINFQESQKKKSLIGLGVSGFLGVTGAIGGLITFNGTSIVYGISSVANIFSAIAHTSNLIMAKNIIGQLKKTLDKAHEEEKKIEQQIDNLINELIKRIQQDSDPKFGLNISFSSISSFSTNFNDLDFVIIDNYC